MKDSGGDKRDRQTPALCGGGRFGPIQALDRLSGEIGLR